MEEREHSWSCFPWRQLPSAIQLNILSLLPPNDRALSGRLVSPDVAAALSDAEAHTASLSQPLPSHAAPWAVEAGQQHVRQLPFRHKLQLLCTAAASGCEVNLEVALALLQPSVFPEMLIDHGSTWTSNQDLPDPDPAVTAMRAGHPQLLGWLLRHCPTLVSPQRALEAAAMHADLAGLKHAWEALRREPASPRWDRVQGPALGQTVLDAAASSTTSDALAKMEWLLDTAAGTCRVEVSTAACVVRLGDVGRLAWLRDRGCPLASGAEWLLYDALRHAGDTHVVRWLVAEGGCDILRTAERATRVDDYWGCLMASAASSQDGLARVLWLQEQGAPLQRGFGFVVRGLDEAPATLGLVQLVHHMQQVSGLWAAERAEIDRVLLNGAVDSGSIQLVEYMLQLGCRLWSGAYLTAAVNGDLAMVEWMVCDAGVSAADLELKSFIEQWPSKTPVHSRDLLQAVQLLVGGAGCRCRCEERYGNARGAVEAAAGRGDLALVQYLLQQQQLRGCRCVPDGRTVVAAAKGGCEALLEWLAGTYPSCLESAGDDASPYASAAAAGDRATLELLRRLGVPWGAEDVVVQAVGYRGQLWGVGAGSAAPAVRWLVGQGAPVGSGEALRRAMAEWGCRDGAACAWLRGLAEAQEATAAAAAAAAGED